MKTGGLLKRWQVRGAGVTGTLRMCETHRLGIASEHLFPMRHTHFEEVSIRRLVLEMHVGACMHATHTCLSTVLISKFPLNWSSGRVPAMRINIGETSIGSSYHMLRLNETTRITNNESLANVFAFA